MAYRLDGDNDPKNYNLDLNCPRCGNLVRALPEAGPIFETGVQDQSTYLICRCPRKYCTVFFVEYDILNSQVRRVYPYPDSSPSDFHKIIPEKIREDIAEAKRCYFADAYKGVVTMCRRTMQQILVQHKAKGGTLESQIDDMFDKGLITKSLGDAAHTIRFFGNFGAHPQKDNLDKVSFDEAKSVLDLTEEFLIDLYIRPFKTKEITRAKQT